jgi:hypothetical protein
MKTNAGTPGASNIATVTMLRPMVALAQRLATMRMGREKWASQVVKLAAHKDRR